MIVDWLKRKINARADKLRTEVLRYQREATADAMATLVLQNNLENAQILALRYERISRELRQRGLPV